MAINTDTRLSIHSPKLKAFACGRLKSGKAPRCLKLAGFRGRCFPANGRAASAEASASAKTKQTERLIMLENEIYRSRVLISARDAEDGETPTVYAVTKESNGFAVWRCSAESEGWELKNYRHLGIRDRVIDECYRMAEAEYSAQG